MNDAHRQRDEQAPWWRSGVVYQIYPRSFADSNRDGVGDLPGILGRLDYLSDTLGVDAVWISPFFRSPMRDFGYDVSCYTDIDPLFGSLADAEALIEAVHARGMKMIFDYVSNHTSIEHSWFVDSRSSRTSDRRDWYVWRDPSPNGGPPNNWLSAFGGPAWTFDEQSGQYYLHSFLPSMPDVNWRSPGLRDAMYGVLRFWLDRGVDGLRIDAAHFVGKDPDFRDNPPAPAGSWYMHKPMGAYDSQIHLYDKGHAFTHEVYRGIRRLIDEYSAAGRDRLMIGEMHLYDWQEWATYFGPDLDEFHLPYNFGLLQSEWSATGVRELVRNIEAATPPGGWPNWVIGNHDESRVATRLGAEQARAAMALLLTLRGTPTIYYGDELGFVDGDVPPELRQDPWGLQVTDADVGRDPARCPMLWSTKGRGGFCPDDVRPWLPPIDPKRFSVEAQIDKPSSMLSLTRKFLDLRKARKSLQLGSFAEIEGLPPDAFGFLRAHEDERTSVIVSLSDHKIDIKHEAFAASVVLATSQPAYNDVEQLADGRFTLQPHQVIVFGD